MLPSPDKQLLLDHLLVFVTALGINLMIAGDAVRAYVPRALNPLGWMIHAVAWVERKLNRAKRSPRARFIRGALMTFGLLAASILCGWGLSQGTRIARGMHEYGWLAEALLVSLFIPVRQVNDALTEVVEDYTRVSLAELRTALGMAYPHDTKHLDSHTLFRAGIELSVQTISERLVGLALWYIALGLPGLGAVVVLGAVNAQIGYTDERFRDFGDTVRRLHGLAQLIPSLISSLMLAVAAFLAPGSAPLAGVQALFLFIRTPVQLPYAVMAGATSVSLLGPKTMGDTVAKQDWVGTDTIKATATHLRIALGVFRIAAALCLCALIYIATVAK